MLSGHINRDAVPLDAVVWLRWLWTDEYYIFWFLKDLIVMIALTPALYLVLKNHKNSVSGWVGFGCLELPYEENPEAGQDDPGAMLARGEGICR